MFSTELFPPEIFPTPLFGRFVEISARIYLGPIDGTELPGGFIGTPARIALYWDQTYSFASLDPEAVQEYRGMCFQKWKRVLQDEIGYYVEADDFAEAQALDDLL